MPKKLKDPKNIDRKQNNAHQGIIDSKPYDFHVVQKEPNVLNILPFPMHILRNSQFRRNKFIFHHFLNKTYSLFSRNICFC